MDANNVMKQYISDNEFATVTLIEAVTRESVALGKLHDRHRALLQAPLGKGLYHNFLNHEFDDARANYTYGQWYTLNGQAKPLLDDIKHLEQSIINKRIAVATLSGALLQIGKQGLSTVFGKDKHSSPTGRHHKQIPLREIIWEGRNQSQHFEEGAPRKGVVHLFGELEKAEGPEFSLDKYGNENLAKKVIDLLGWNDFGRFESDMLSFTEKP
jgi:hypothetical protein